MMGRRLIDRMRAVPGARPAARALRRARVLYGPLPLPQYTTPVPRTSSGAELETLLPPNTSTLGAGATALDNIDFVLDVLQRLTETDEVIRETFFYKAGQVKFGKNWRYADIMTVLRVAALMTQAKSYLEIGVRRGRSAAIVGACAPRCAIYGFDLWLEGYAGAENPGPEFVREELLKAGHVGPVELVSGDSKVTVPRFLRDRPELYLDLITIDGDHSVQGAATDLANTLPRLKVGGIVVFDDLCVSPLLQHVWERVIKRDQRYVSWEFTEAGAGIAAAVRISDVPGNEPLYWHGT